MNGIAFASCAIICMSAQPAASQRAEQEFGDMFCSYVAIFTEQITRNRMRDVPYGRLQEFNYFDGAKSNFLETIAREIYSVPLSGIESYSAELRPKYEALCEDLFGEQAS